MRGARRDCGVAGCSRKPLPHHDYCTTKYSPGRPAAPVVVILASAGMRAVVESSGSERNYANQDPVIVQHSRGVDADASLVYCSVDIDDGLELAEGRKVGRCFHNRAIRSGTLYRVVRDSLSPHRDGMDVRAVVTHAGRFPVHTQHIGGSSCRIRVGCSPSRVPEMGDGVALFLQAASSSTLRSSSRWRRAGIGNDGTPELGIHSVAR